MSTGIASWSLERVGGNLVRPVVTARAEWSERVGVLVRLRDDEGREGLGEITPLAGYTSGTLAECAEATAHVVEHLADVRADPAEALAAMGFQLVAGGGRSRLALLPVLKLLLRQVDDHACARFGLETALLDLLGRQLGVPVSRLLAPAVHERVEVNGLLPRFDDLEAAERLVARGLRVVKVKVGLPGGTFEDELAALRRLRERLGPDVAIRIDAGGAWTVEEARERLGRLADEVAPELCEEPTSGEGLLRLGPTAVPWAADETLRMRRLTGAILDAEGLFAVVLKPAMLGGAGPCLDLARRAAARGVHAIVTHLFDGPVGLAAACELALALPDTPLACGLDPHPGLEAWPPVEVPHLAVPGFAAATDRPGLGIAWPGCR